MDKSPLRPIDQNPLTRNGGYHTLRKDYFEITLPYSRRKYYASARLWSVDRDTLTVRHLIRHIKTACAMIVRGRGINLYSSDRTGTVLRRLRPYMTAREAGLTSRTLCRIKVSYAKPRLDAPQLPLRAHPTTEPPHYTAYTPSESTREVLSGSKDCTVCGTSLPPTDFAFTITANCQHQPNTCIPCLQNWISAQMDSNGWNSIRCPECSQLLGHQDVKSLASGQVFERFVATLTGIQR